MEQEDYDAAKKRFKTYSLEISNTYSFYFTRKFSTLLFHRALL